MNPGYPGRSENDPIDEFSSQKHSALSGSDVFGELEGKNPKQDGEIKDKIREKLYGHPEHNFSRVDIDVKDGFVALTGLIDNPEAKATAEALAESIDGVVDVASLLELDKESAIPKSLSGHKDLRLSKN